MYFLVFSTIQNAESILIAVKVADFIKLSYLIGISRDIIEHVTGEL